MPLMIMIISLLAYAGIDIVIYRFLKRQFKSSLPRRIYLWSALVLFLVVIIGVCLPRRSGSDDVLLAVMWIVYGYASVFFPKAIFALCIGIGAIPRLWKGHNWRVLPWVGLGLGLFAFLAMWWGAFVNRFDHQIVETEIGFSNLPDDFDGYRIVQISDFHVGTYGNDTTFVSEIVDVVNGLHGDAIFFTGDIVNRRTEELLPMVSALSRLSAPDGVYSILGNHDYGDYSEWETPQAKQRNMELLYDLQHKMGWRLLRNETVRLHRGNDSIALIGVENVGDPPFTVYGDLDKAYPSLSDDRFKILLTHNPAHWTMDIAGNDTAKVDLSLSGHTHAMQMEVDIMGHRYSPSVFRYRTWGGLYKDDGGKHKLYVNIGLGTVGFPARIGATPEITVITLRKEK